MPIIHENPTKAASKINGKGKRAASLVAASLLSGLFLGQGLTSGSAAAQEQRYVRSLLEIRREKVITQEFDLSCGAAALATILTYQHGDPVPEEDIAKELIRRKEYIANPDIVRARQGFSFFDLQRYVDARGYSGEAYGNLTYEDILDMAPIIVPVNFTNYNHFVVFRGAYGNRVLMSDPAYGNRTTTLERFMKAWIAYPDVGKVGMVVKRRDDITPPNRLAPRPQDFVTLG